MRACIHAYELTSTHIMHWSPALVNLHHISLDLYIFMCMRFHLFLQFQNATKEQDHQISVSEKNIADQIKEADELKDIVKRQQALVCELDEQLNQQKSITNSREKELDELKESNTQMANIQISDVRMFSFVVKIPSMNVHP